MKLVTIQASAIKSTFEVLKDILNDVNIYFKEDGLYITSLDTARVARDLFDVNPHRGALTYEEFVHSFT